MGRNDHGIQLSWRGLCAQGRREVTWDRWVPQGMGSQSLGLRCFHIWLLMVFLFLQENVSNAQVENADFGLNISKIQKNGTEEKAHPRRVSGTQDPRVGRGSLFLSRKKEITWFLPNMTMATKVWKVGCGVRKEYPRRTRNLACDSDLPAPFWKNLLEWSFSRDHRLLICKWTFRRERVLFSLKIQWWAGV